MKIFDFEGQTFEGNSRGNGFKDQLTIIVRQQQYSKVVSMISELLFFGQEKINISSDGVVYQINTININKNLANIRVIKIS